MGKRDQFLENSPSLPIASVGNVSNFEMFVGKEAQEDDCLSCQNEGASEMTRLWNAQGQMRTSVSSPDCGLQHRKEGPKRKLLGRPKIDRLHHQLGLLGPPISVMSLEFSQLS
ncbi:hypothetical protein Ancab_015302 [Ancistrocladus abbreviatus]